MSTTKQPRSRLPIILLLLGALFLLGACTLVGLLSCGIGLLNSKGGRNHIDCGGSLSIEVMDDPSQRQPGQSMGEGAYLVVKDRQSHASVPLLFTQNVPETTAERGLRIDDLAPPVPRQALYDAFALRIYLGQPELSPTIRVAARECLIRQRPAFREALSWHPAFRTGPNQSSTRFEHLTFLDLPGPPAAVSPAGP